MQLWTADDRGSIASGDVVGRIGCGAVSGNAADQLLYGPEDMYISADLRSLVHVSTTIAESSGACAATLNSHCFLLSGSSKMPSTSSRLLASSSAHVCILMQISSPRDESCDQLLTSCLACSNIRPVRTASFRRSRRTRCSPILRSHISLPASHPTTSLRADRNDLREHDLQRFVSPLKRLVGYAGERQCNLG